MLIGTRFLQGALAGTMIPQILFITHATFPASERSKAYGLFGAIVGCASAAGMVVGGLLVQGDLLSAIQEVGMALGVALAGAVFSGYLGGPGQAATQLGALTGGAAGPGAVAHDFIRAFSLSLWYPVGILAAFFAGLFALPRRARVRDLDAELEAAETGASGPEAFDRAQSAGEPLA